MISATDSFVTYLSTEMAGNPAVYWVRKTANDATAHLLRLNALSVTILSFKEKGTYEEVLISLDIIGDDERQVLDWTKLVRDKLIERQYVSEFDYESTPASPTSLGRLVSWDGRDISFDIVKSDEHSIHLNATFTICHVRQ